eukprot:scaffold627499_cov15-Prasinocladus_malaysianus.AAC.1
MTPLNIIAIRGRAGSPSVGGSTSDLFGGDPFATLTAGSSSSSQGRQAHSQTASSKSLLDM